MIAKRVTAITSLLLTLAAGCHHGAFANTPVGTQGAVGLVVCIVGAISGKGSLDDSQVLGVMFVCLFGIVGGLLEMSVRYGWHILGA